ncbi:hypothetical protein NA57DRAFT_77904 [Rhizodiscina lignyota]|uniref:Uncharacterized protein n=1 Tax=Rhizodiscina lignyota TaxID=1504668 RepID=A0A9P4IFQ6_9PEZI|nr:hypothetical protein NA57DRAFT_77904 [Rhizodiscina lignyota]
MSQLLHSRNVLLCCLLLLFILISLLSFRTANVASSSVEYPPGNGGILGNTLLRGINRDDENRKRHESNQNANTSHITIGTSVKAPVNKRAEPSDVEMGEGDDDNGDSDGMDIVDDDDDATGSGDDEPSEDSADQIQNWTEEKKDQLWTASFEKGAALQCVAKESKEDARKLLDAWKVNSPLDSQYTSYNDLDKNGWVTEDEAKTDPETLKREVGGDALKAIGVDLTRLQSIATLHLGMTDEWEHEGTNAYYNAEYDALNGVIIVTEARSPEYMVKEGRAPHGAAVPDMKHWSDITFLEWAHVAGSRVAGLSNILHMDVDNPESVWIAEKVIGGDGLPEEWAKAKEISPSTQEGQALLGSPNGGGVGWLLAQHKDALGKKAVRGIKVFATPGHPERMNVLFRIGRA